jgi:hypothetical protein
VRTCPHCLLLLAGTTRARTRVRARGAAKGWHVQARLLQPYTQPSRQTARPT